MLVAVRRSLMVPQGTVACTASFPYPKCFDFLLTKGSAHIQIRLYTQFATELT